MSFTLDDGRTNEVWGALRRGFGTGLDYARRLIEPRQPMAGMTHALHVDVAGLRTLLALLDDLAATRQPPPCALCGGTGGIVGRYTYPDGSEYCQHEPCECRLPKPDPERVIGCARRLLAVIAEFPESPGSTWQEHIDALDRALAGQPAVRYDPEW